MSTARIMIDLNGEIQVIQNNKVIDDPQTKLRFLKISHEDYHRRVNLGRINQKLGISFPVGPQLEDESVLRTNIQVLGFICAEVNKLQKSIDPQATPCDRGNQDLSNFKMREM